MLLMPTPRVSAVDDTEPPDGKLGFGFFVLAGKDENSDGLERNNRMWFAIEPGKTGSREFRVSSTSQVTQSMSMGLVAGERENGGVLVAAPAATSDAANWVSFEPSNFDLKPRESKTVKITFAPPPRTKPVFIESFIEVNANTKAAQKTQFAIPTALATNFPITLTVGSADQLAIDFELVDIEGFLDEKGPKLRVYIRNKGRTPISPSGFVQLSSLDFDSVRSDELKFAGTSIFPNSVGFIDVSVAEPVVAGKWKVLVSASQGSTRATKIFEKNLTFDGPPKGIDIPFSIDIQRILFALFAVMLLVLAKRSKSKTAVESEGKKNSVLLLRKRMLSSTTSKWKKVKVVRNRKNSKKPPLNSDSISNKPKPHSISQDEQAIEKVSGDTPQNNDGASIPGNRDSKYKSILAATPKWLKSAQLDPAVTTELNDEVEQSVEVAEDIQNSNQILDQFQEIKLNSKKLREVQKLFTDGVISKAQFDKKRREILDKM